MTLDTALTTNRVDPEVTAAMEIYDRLKPLKDALGMGSLTEPEMQLFAMVAQHTGLDPFTKQIYAIKRAGKVTHQTGIDGYRSTAEIKTGQYAGSDEAVFENCGCELAPAGHPAVARVVVHRLLPNGHMVNQTGVARWHELYPGSGEDGFMWRKMMHNQLAKCAEANGLRKAFPRVLGGIYIAEEMAQSSDVTEGQATVLPTAAERIAARRTAAEAKEGAAEPADEPDTERKGDAEPQATAPAPLSDEDEATFAQAEAIVRGEGCQWILATKSGRLICGIVGEHKDHAWMPIAMSEGGKVIRPEAVPA